MAFNNKIFTLLFFVKLIEAMDQWQCTCEQLMTEYDCMSQQKNRYNTGDVDQSAVCFWYQDQCQNLMNYISDISCSSLSKDQCNYIGTSLYQYNPICVWYQTSLTDGYCSKFTRCQDYSYTDDITTYIQCQNIGCSSNEKKKCSFDYRGRQEQFCSQISVKEQCNKTFLKDKYTICQWDQNENCSDVEFELCSDLTNESQCNQANTFCRWKNDLCQERTCSDQEQSYLSSTQICISFYSLLKKVYIQCQLNANNDCIEGNAEDLIESNCNYYSRFTYQWNTTTTSCTSCLYIGYDYILLIQGFLLFISQL